MVNHLKYFCLILVVNLCFAGCGALVQDPIPVREGNVMRIQKAPEVKVDDSTLTIRWFGTASYEIKLGGVSILTDPFVSYKSLYDVLAVSRSYNHMRSNKYLVVTNYRTIQQVPKAIFIGHSHYDHMMDTVAALTLLEGWRGVPVYGSGTTRNILHGYPKCEPPIPNELCEKNTVLRWSENWRSAEMNDDWEDINPGLSYWSFEGTHASHILGYTFWDDTEAEELNSPPTITRDFQQGTAYIHFFKFKLPPGHKDKSFTVGLASAASKVPNNLMRHKGLLEGLDILILCVPGWDKIEGEVYPKNLLEILKPRIILLSHYDDFFEPDRNEDPKELVLTVKLNDFLNNLQLYISEIPNYTQFETILMPGVGATLSFEKAKNNTLEISGLSE
jgi:hypothetical protein